MSRCWGRISSAGWSARRRSVGGPRCCRRSPGGRGSPGRRSTCWIRMIRSRRGSCCERSLRSEPSNTGRPRAAARSLRGAVVSVELQRTSLREQVGNALRAAMVSGTLRPGVIYSAPALAATFGVSATPVREAMLDLAKEGLVEAVRNKGFRITEVSERDLDELTELRLLIEVPTTARLAGRLDAAALAELRELAAAIEAGAAAGDLIGYLEADREFHLTLLGHTGNR